MFADSISFTFHIICMIHEQNFRHKFVCCRCMFLLARYVCFVARAPPQSKQKGTQWMQMRASHCHVTKKDSLSTLFCSKQPQCYYFSQRARTHRRLLFTAAPELASVIFQIPSSNRDPCNTRANAAECSISPVRARLVFTFHLLHSIDALWRTLKIIPWGFLFIFFCAKHIALKKIQTNSLT